ncbi:MAG TPA: glycosyltransferase family 2 protein [Chloroflexota bacterium]|jgi:dolichol-phosphate mannosyltransferase
MDLTIIIPCFNESDSIPTLYDELTPVVAALRRDRSVEVVFVDDGSTDNTGDLLAAAFRGDPDVRVIAHDRNRGLGAALRTGYGHARGRVVVTADSDATYPFRLIPSLLDRLQSGADIVTGSCYHPDGGIENVPAYRILLSRSASTIYRLIVDRRVHTYTCMFRAYRRQVLDSVELRADGFLGVTELLVNAMLLGYSVAELPCTLRMRRYGASKAKLARTTRAHLAFQGQIARARVLQLVRPSLPAKQTR